MPELPEVETIARDLRPHVTGRTIIGARVHWARTIAYPGARAFAQQIRQHQIDNITRRGKYLIFHLHHHTPRYWLVHLRMTGGFYLATPQTARDEHTHVIVQLDDGNELRFRDPRKFGRMWLVDDPQRVIGTLGPEPLEISAREFCARLAQHRGRLKPLLLNQTIIAGIGNIYADEALWYARLHPLCRVESLTRAECGRLHRAIRSVLTRAIALGGTSIDVMYKRVNGKSGGFTESLRAFDREQRPCRRCGTPIQKIVVGQRGTHFCPTCQRLIK
jgi:formamidopyrimidine-DNA glycosylase